MKRLRIDSYILMLVGTVALASFLPARGAGAAVVGAAADIGIVVLFFMHGARLSRQSVLDGAKHWRLHGAVGSVTYLVFPIIGLAMAALPLLDPWMRTGLFFLTLLPSTVQSSIAFTAMARGNVAGAVCSAAFSNIVGIFLTPLLVAVFLTGQQGGISGKMVLTIVTQLLLPFLAGHLLQPWLAGWIARQKKLLTVIDRGTILLVVYAAFSAAVIDGLWARVSPGDLLLLVGMSCAMLAIVLTLTRLLGKWLNFSREDIIVLQYCGSKKSLASGVPMAGVLFPAATVGTIILPLMIFHQIQLMVCAVLAARYGRDP